MTLTIKMFLGNLPTVEYTISHFPQGTIVRGAFIPEQYIDNFNSIGNNNVN